MSLYAASNIAHAVKSFGKRGYATLQGLILNAKNIDNEQELVSKAAEEIGAPILYHLPRDPLIQQAEALGKTVVETFPDSPLTAHYRQLAQLLTEQTDGGEPCS